MTRLRGVGRQHRRSSPRVGDHRCVGSALEMRWDCPEGMLSGGSAGVSRTNKTPDQTPISAPGGPNRIMDVPTLNQRVRGVESLMAHFLSTD